ncbi:hypothetical protein NDU88_004315 [Pleurodeles waltl]|uniref:Uncharacterized protein n=1 Tax=Pleurodeles waltl TaxID=8319 RepID=A0AAV7QE41_PLEWA|nr:hypothetical protein NDU88_004315 [Pleurodeles waltl]
MEMSMRGMQERCLGACLEVWYSPTQVDAEDGLREQVLLHEAVQYSGRPFHRDGGVRQAQDTVKLSGDEVGARLIYAQAILLLSDGDALELEEGIQQMYEQEEPPHS